MNDCQNCIHFSGRLMISGKLQWGKFCTFPAYGYDLLPVEIKQAIVVKRYTQGCTLECSSGA
jgi:hypothetical protein